MSPSRRTLLRTCGVALAGAAAGCVSSGGSDSTTATRATKTTENGAPTVREVDGVARNVPSALAATSSEVDPSEDPFRSLAVGSREGVPNPDDNRPHVLAVWNDTEEVTTVELALTAEGATVLDGEYEFDAGANLAMELREPRTYELTVRAGDREAVVEVERGRFDCNDSAVEAVVREGEIETTGVTTDMDCSVV